MDCLETKLKAVSTNTDLEKFNIVKGKVKVPPSGTYAYLTITSGETVIVTILDDNVTFYGGKKTNTFVGTGSQQFFSLLGSGEAEIEIYNPWAIKKSYAQYIGLDIAFFKYNRVSTSLGLDGQVATPSLYSGDIAIIGDCTQLAEINVNNSSVGGNIEELADKLWMAGKRTGKFSVYCQNSNVKYYGASRVLVTIQFAQDWWKAT